MESPCFLCCGVGTGTRQEKVRWRGICRYLKINVDQFLKEKDCGNLVDKDVVELCTQCSSIIVPLDKLCMELEVLQMKVDHMLKSVLDVLGDSFATLSSIQISGQREKGPREFTEFLRDQMKKKCEKQLSRVFPKLQILTNDPSFQFKSKSKSIFENAENENPHKKGPLPYQSMPDKEKDKKLENVQSSKKYQCNFCERAFCLPETLERHMQVGHNRQCKICGIIFKFASNLRSHMKVKHSSGASVIKCDLCSKHFLNKSRFLTHRKLAHFDNKPTCGICGQVFAYTSGLSKHKKTQHTKDIHHHRDQQQETRLNGSSLGEKADCGDITAVVPNAAVPEQSTENGNVLKRRSKPKTEICNMCIPLRLAATRQHKIKYHLDQWFLPSKLPHLGVDEFLEYCKHAVQAEVVLCTKVYDAHETLKVKCPSCPFITSADGNMRKLRDHLCSTHKDDVVRRLLHLQRSIKPEELKRLPFPSLNWSEEDRHKSHVQVSKCDVCGLVFQHKQSLWRHKLAKHEKNVSRPKCDVCGYVPQYKHDLLKHKRSVHRELFSLKDATHHEIVNCEENQLVEQAQQGSPQIQFVEHPTVVSSGITFFDESVDAVSEYPHINRRDEEKYFWNVDDYSNVIGYEFDNDAKGMENEMKILPD